MGLSFHRAVESDGLQIVEWAGSKNLDALFLSASFTASLNEVFQDCAKALKPGGQLLFCFTNRLSVKNLKNIFLANKKQGYLLADALRAARSAGFSARSVYGIYDNFSEPRFFVPLGQPGAAKYFFETMLTPYSTSTRRFLDLASLMLALRLDSALFADFCLVLDLPC
jgi:SAM-dependent methyltransferase